LHSGFALYINITHIYNGRPSPKLQPTHKKGQLKHFIVTYRNQP
jgi:hypothetical protein